MIKGGSDSSRPKEMILSISRRSSTAAAIQAVTRTAPIQAAVAAADGKLQWSAPSNRRR
jgi:hypothetical protein